jgi:DNA-binding transcriptional MerR regulator
MAAGLTVGDFSRATHLRVKTLRHYHQVGLLQPATVNPDTGYRSLFTRFRSILGTGGPRGT